MLTHSIPYVKGDIFTYRQWVCWVYDGKKKVPIDAKTGKKAKPNDCTTWASYHQAITASGFDGIGFVFSEDDEVCGVDIDNCRNPDTGEVAAWAQEIVDAHDTYTEISPSGAGLKLWFFGSKPGPRCKAKLGSGAIEIYDRGRFFTFTNRVYLDKPIRNAQTALNALYARLFPEPTATPHKPASTRSMEDRKVLELARNAKNGEKFSNLFDRGSGSGNHSNDDLALIQMLCFYTRDPAQLDRLYRGSALMRDKWDEVHYADGRTHGEGTIQKAIRTNKKTYTPKPVVDSVVQEKLECLQTLAEDLPWNDKSRGSTRAAYGALIYTGFVRGQEHQEGIQVQVSVRQLCEVACISDFKAMVKAIETLEDHGLVYVIKRGRNSETSNTYLLRTPTTVTDNTYIPCVNTLLSSAVAALFLRIRNNGIHKPGGEKLVRSVDQGRKVSHVVYYDDVPPTVSGSIGKSGALILEKVLVAGGSMTIKALAKALGSKRVNDTRKRVQRIVDAGLLLMEGDTVEAPEDLPERLEQHLQDTGCVLAEYKQKVRHLEDRIKVDRAPTDAELAQASEAVLAELQRIADADGMTDELETYDKEWDTFVPQDEPQQPIPVPIQQPPHPLSCECIGCSAPEPKYARRKDGKTYQPRSLVDMAA